MVNQSFYFQTNQIKNYVSIEIKYNIGCLSFNVGNITNTNEFITETITPEITNHGNQ